MSDNLLAGATGFLEGFEKGYLPFLQSRQQIALRDYLAQKEAERNLIPSEQIPESLRKDLNIPLGQKIRPEIFNALYRNLPVSLISPEGQNIGQVPARSKILSPTESPVITEEEALQSGTVKRGTRIVPSRQEQVMTEEQALEIGKVPKGTRIIKPKPTLSPTIQREASILKSIINSYDVLIDTFKQAKGSSGVIGGGLKSLTSTITGGTAFPDFKVYNDRKREFNSTAQKTLTGTSRQSQVAVDLAVQSLPEGLEAPEVDVKKAMQGRNLMVDRYEQLTGEPFENKPKVDISTLEDMTTTPLQNDPVQHILKTVPGSKLLKIRKSNP